MVQGIMTGLIAADGNMIFSRGTATTQTAKDHKHKFE